MHMRGRVVPPFVGCGTLRRFFDVRDWRDSVERVGLG